MHASPRRMVQFLEGQRGRADHQKRQPDFHLGGKGEALLAVNIRVHPHLVVVSIFGGRRTRSWSWSGVGVFRGFSVKKQRIGVGLVGNSGLSFL